METMPARFASTVSLPSGAGGGSGSRLAERWPVSEAGAAGVGAAGGRIALTDTAGADAPTSRSWKTGFLTKRSSRIALVDAAHALRLSNYVGQRIAATGTLLNHEMQTQSMYRVATSCS